MKTPNSFDNRDFEALPEAYLEAPGETLSEALEHILDKTPSEDIGQEMAVMLDTASVLQALPSVEPSADFNQRLQAKLQAQNKPSVKIFGWPGWRSLALSAAAVAVGFILWQPAPEPVDQISDYLQTMPVQDQISHESSWGLEQKSQILLAAAPLDLGADALNYPVDQIHSQPQLGF